MKYLLIILIASPLMGCKHHGYRETAMCKTIHHGYGLATTRCYEKIQPPPIEEASDEAD